MGTKIISVKEVTPELLKDAFKPPRKCPVVVLETNGIKIFCGEEFFWKRRYCLAHSLMNEETKK